MAPELKGDLLDNIDILLAKYLSGQANVSEAETVKAWIVNNDHNSKYYMELQQIWLGTRITGHYNKPDVTEALDRFRRRLTSTRTRHLSAMRWIQIAAVVVLIAGIVIARKLNTHHNTSSEALVTLSAGAAEQLETLPDGSTVRLLPNAQLSYSPVFTKDHRQVQLKGSAFFLVQHDANHPFEVSVNHVKVTVLGTSFSILDSADITEVRVFTGLVRVTSNNQQLKVFPLEKLTISANGEPLLKQVDTVVQPTPTQRIAPQASRGTVHVTAPDTLVDKYDQQLRTMRAVLDEAISEHLAATRKEIIWLALTSDELIINDVKQPDSVYRKFQGKFQVQPDASFFYGSVKITGKGYFFNSDDFDKKKS